jgi:oligopeptide transport system ATP-binding protein
VWQPVDGLLLEVDRLQVEFRTRDGVAKAINGVSFELHEGETLAILGESGSGKSVTAQAIMGILDSPPGFVTGGEVRYCGQNILAMSDEQRRRIRGPEISMVFQDALSALNPVFSVGWQIAEMFRKHRGMNKSDSQAQAIRLMQRVQIPGAAQRVKAYPHQFSGGMRQRIMIAIALTCEPRLIIADEPTTALDVTIQAQILDLLQDMKSRFGMSIMLITHAMGVVAEVAQRVVVMYAGKVVEEASVERLFANPRHPYTQGLIRSIPRLDMAATRKTRLQTIAGTVPKLIAPPPGCRFAARCNFATDACRIAEPALRELEPGHKVACIHAEAVVVQ